MSAYHQPISLAGLTLPALSPSLLVEVAADTGFDAVGVNLMQVWRTVAGDPRWFAAEVENLSSILQTRRLKLTHGGHLLLGGLDKKAAEYILAAMHQLDVQHLVLVVAPQAAPADVEADLAFVHARAKQVPMLVEFAPYTGLKGLSDAMLFVEQHSFVQLALVVDVLHLVRSNSVASLSSGQEWPVGLIQMCDAPLQSPGQDGLQMEARGNRLDVGEGELPLAEIFAKLPNNVPIEIEAPCLALRNLAPRARAQRSFQHLITFLQGQGYMKHDPLS